VNDKTAVHPLVIACLLATISLPATGIAKDLLLFGGPAHDSFLGCVTCSHHHSDSIWNKRGTYGSRFSPSSIWNKFGEYGSKFSQYSPWNNFSTTAPAIVDRDGKSFGYFSINRFHPSRTMLEALVWILDNHEWARDHLDEVGRRFSSEADRESLSESLLSPPRATPSSTIDSTSILTDIQAALRVLGYNPGIDPSTVDDPTMHALNQYRESKGLPPTESGMRLAVIYLGLDISDRSRDPSVLRLSLRLMSAFSKIEESPPQGHFPPIGPSAGQCDHGHWVAKVLADGEFVKLEDNSLWQIDVIDRIDTTLWLPTEEIVICEDLLINTDSGDKVQARQIR
jgi:hypothetical protein